MVSPADLTCKPAVGVVPKPREPFDDKTAFWEPAILNSIFLLDAEFMLVVPSDDCERA